MLEFMWLIKSIDNGSEVKMDLREYRINLETRRALLHNRKNKWTDPKSMLFKAVLILLSLLCNRNVQTNPRTPEVDTAVLSS